MAGVVSVDAKCTGEATQFLVFGRGPTRLDLLDTILESHVRNERMMGEKAYATAAIAVALLGPCQ